MKQDYVVYFESHNYCGGEEYCIVSAEDQFEAMGLATDYAEDFYREQDEDQFISENGEDEAEDVIWAYIKSAELVEDFAHRDLITKRGQERFYPRIN